MAIRDLIRKNRKAEVLEKVQANVEKKKNAKRPAKLRRYSLMVEDVFETSRLQGVMVIGNLYGKVKVGDTMYLYQPDRSVKEVHVVTIELGPRDEVEVAKNQQVGLCLDLESIEEVSKYAVLSSVKPLPAELAERIIENPRLFGLMMEYRRLYTNSNYMDEVLKELCHAKFVVPLYMDRPPVPQEDGKVGFGSDAQVGFRALKKWDDASKTVFPAFTDEVALMSWKDAYHEGQPKRLATMQLPYIIDYVDKGGHAGFVANPFGPVSVYFPRELLKQVQASEVFEERYLMKEENK